jgi:hypothetical protein
VGTKVANGHNLPCNAAIKECCEQLAAAYEHRYTLSILNTFISTGI